MADNTLKGGLAALAGAAKGDLRSRILAHQDRIREEDIARDEEARQAQLRSSGAISSLREQQLLELQKEPEVTGKWKFNKDLGKMYNENTGEVKEIGFTPEAEPEPTLSAGERVGGELREAQRTLAGGTGLTAAGGRGIGPPTAEEALIQDVDIPILKELLPFEEPKAPARKLSPEVQAQIDLLKKSIVPGGTFNVEEFNRAAERLREILGPGAGGGGGDFFGAESFEEVEAAVNDGLEDGTIDSDQARDTINRAKQHFGVQ